MSKWISSKTSDEKKEAEKYIGRWGYFAEDPENFPIEAVIDKVARIDYRYGFLAEHIYQNYYYFVPLTGTLPNGEKYVDGIEVTDVQ